MSPSKKNFIFNIATTFFRIFSTIIIIPFYIENLGQNLYSDWIVIFSISSLFEIANFGINQGVNNQYSILYNRGDKNPRLIITNGISVIILIYLMSMILIHLFWHLFDVYSFLRIDSLTKFNTILIISFLVSKIFVDILTGILFSHFFALDKNFYSILVNLVKYIFEFLLIIIMLSIGYNLSSVSIGIFLNSLILFIFLFFYLKFNSQKIIDFIPNKKVISLIVKPSTAFSILTVSELILHHGFIYITKIFFSSNVVILWNTSRTLVNYVRSFQGLITSSVMPSFNVYFSKGKKEDFNNLFHKTNLIMFVSTFLLVSILYFFKQELWSYWLGDSISINKYLIDYLLLGVLLSSFWIVKSTLIASINRHITYSIIYLISSLFSVLLFLLINNFIKIDYIFLPFFLLFNHISSIIYTYVYTKKIIQKL